MGANVADVYRIALELAKIQYSLVPNINIDLLSKAFWFQTFLCSYNDEALIHKRNLHYVIKSLYVPW